MRDHGGDKGEYGATTGRPRRMGWFDCVATRYGCRVQGATQVVLTALDCLAYLDEIKVCTGYEIDGVVTKDFPVTAKLKKAKPCSKPCPDLNRKSAAWGGLKICRRPRRIMWRLSSGRSVCLSQWSPTAQSAVKFSSANKLRLILK